MDATSPVGPRRSRATATDPGRATTHAWAALRMVAPSRPNLTAKLAMMPHRGGKALPGTAWRGSWLPIGLQCFHTCGGKSLPGYRVEWLVAALR